METDMENAFFDLILHDAVKARTRLNVGSRKHQSLNVEFPLAKLGSLVSPELNEVWEAKLHASEKLGRSESLPLYEKVGALMIIVCPLTFFNFMN